MCVCNTVYVYAYASCFRSGTFAIILLRKIQNKDVSRLKVVQCPYCLCHSGSRGQKVFASEMMHERFATAVNLPHCPLTPEREKMCPH